MRSHFFTYLLSTALPVVILMGWDTHSNAAEPIRVMSFNIRYGTAKDGDDVWPNRRQLVAETISRFAPDLLGTQETLPFQANYLAEQLPEYQYIGWSRDTSKDGEQCGIFFRKERFQVVDSGQFWLSESPDEKFSKSWDSSLPRVATWVVLQDLENERRSILFVNTHFDHRGVTARLESAKLLHQRVVEMQRNMPTVVTGDFNCDQGSEPYNALTQANQLGDTLRIVHPQPVENEGTFHGFKGQAGRARIDWILVSPQWTVESAAINEHHQEDRYPSDHFPVTAVLNYAEATTGEN